MQKDKDLDADASGLPGSDSESPFGPDDPSDGFQRSAKLKEKLRKLAKWRLDRSPIEFFKDAPEFRGGNATVSRAALVYPLSSPTEKDQSCPTKSKRTDSDGHEGEASGQRKSIAVKKMNISGDRARVLGLALREAEFLVDISHENVIELEGFVEDLSNDTIWLVFPWAENGTLRDFIAAADWDIPERISLINDVTGGVEYLHSRQPPLRHGDLKSMNILVGSDCRARISDFGSARRLSAKDLDKEKSQTDNKQQAALSLEATFCSSNNTIGITLTGDSYTLRWAAPEVLREEEASLGSDIWSLGWVAYEVMTNSVPFQDVVKDAIVIRRIIQGDLPSLNHDARMSLIQTLCSLMLACWSIDPRERPTAQDCRRSISGMPMILPNSIRITEMAASRNRSPALLMQLGYMHRRQSDYPNALDFFTKALSGYADIGDRQGNAMAQVQLAQVYWFRYEYCQAATSYSEALQILTEIGDRQGRAFALCGLAEVHRLQNQYNKAVTLYSEALHIRTEIGDPPGIAQALLGLADVHRHRNEYGQAVTSYSDALRIRTDIGDRRGRADALWGLAEVHRLRNEYNQAIMLNSEALKIYTDIGDRLGRAGALLNLADVHRDQSDYGEAICRYTEAAEIFEQIGDTWNAAYASSEVDEVLRLSSEREEATCLLEELEIRHSSQCL